MGYKHPVSVLVVISARDTGRVLMLQRRDDPTFWQSVTGSLEAGESPLTTACREVHEEVGINVLAEQLEIEDCQRQIDFEIFPHFRHRYAPDVTHNHEHWFRLQLPEERDVTLTEHLAFRWLAPADAAALTRSWSNRQAIEEFI